MVEKTIWVNGCFDVLHRGHVELFRYAKSLGGQLHIGIDSDHKVNKDKGPTRPIFSQDDRRYMVKAIRYVDYVYIFDSTHELEQLIKRLSPDVMVIGSDWKGKTVVGEQYAKSLEFFNRIKQYSTTNILEWQNQ
jgi:rfaE bifunctional protein nucleotidyltransferase chain/domain